MTEQPDAVMLFAAGFGTRMGALTRDRPKPLIPVAGKPLIDHALELARGIGPGRIVANLHYKAEMLGSHLAPHGILLSHERPRILETGGGLKVALPLLNGDPVFTLNTDAIWAGPNPLKLLKDAWDPAHMDALLMCIAPDRALGHGGAGDFIAGPDGYARRGHGLIYGGAQILKTGGLAAIDEAAFSLNMLWDRILQKHRLRILVYPGRWCDLSRPQNIALAENLLANPDV